MVDAVIGTVETRQGFPHSTRRKRGLNLKCLLRRIHRRLCSSIRNGDGIILARVLHLGGSLDRRLCNKELEDSGKVSFIQQEENKASISIPYCIGYEEGPPVGSNGATVSFLTRVILECVLVAGTATGTLERKKDFLHSTRREQGFNLECLSHRLQARRRVKTR